MSLKKCLGKVLLLSVLEIGAVCGVPIRPDEIERIMKMSSEPAVTHVVRNDEGDGDPPRVRPPGPDSTSPV
ncbi:MAG: hypothetical protein QOE82_269 [Thermoanaerobaculia bacterium]|jgi:hypothetical protein|nr:hypothetical protein [Thermoanaerobaculia bacterium]